MSWETPTGSRDSPPGRARTASRSKRERTCRGRRRCSPRARSTASTRWPAAGSRNTSKRRSRWSAAATTSTSRSPSPTCRRRSGSCPGCSATGSRTRGCSGAPPTALIGEGDRVDLGSAEFDGCYRVYASPKRDDVWFHELFSPAFIVFLIEQSPKGFAFEYVEGTLCVSLHGSDALDRRPRPPARRDGRTGAPDPRRDRRAARPRRRGPLRAGRGPGSRQPPRNPRPNRTKGSRPFCRRRAREDRKGNLGGSGRRGRRRRARRLRLELQFELQRRIDHRLLGRRQRRRHPGRRLLGLPRLHGPGPLAHDRRLDRDLRHLHPAAHLRPRRRQSGRQGDPGPRDGAPRSERRRQDLHDDPAQGAQVLQRRTGRRQRLHPLARTRLRPQLERLALLRRHRRRRSSS